MEVRICGTRIGNLPMVTSVHHTELIRPSSSFGILCPATDNMEYLASAAIDYSGLGPHAAARTGLLDIPYRTRFRFCVVGGVAKEAFDGLENLCPQVHVGWNYVGRGGSECLGCCGNRIESDELEGMEDLQM